MATSADIIPFRQPELKDLIFELDEARTRINALYARPRDLTPAEEAECAALDQRAAGLEAQCDRLFRLAVGLPWSRYRDVRS